MVDIALAGHYQTLPVLLPCWLKLLQRLQSADVLAVLGHPMWHAICAGGTITYRTLATAHATTEVTACTAGSLLANER